MADNPQDLPGTIPSFHSGHPQTPPSVQSRALRGSLWSFAGVALSLPVSILTTFILAQRLGAGQFGEYAIYALLVPLVIGTTDLGLSNAMVQRTGAALGRGDDLTVTKVAACATTWALIRLPVIVLAGFAIFGQSWAAIYFTAVPIVILLTSATGVGLVASVRIRELARLHLIAILGNALVTIILAMRHTSPSLVYSCSIATQYLILALQLFYFRLLPFTLRDAYRLRSPRVFLDDLRFGLATFAAAQLTTLAVSRTELLFFGERQQIDRGSFAAGHTLGTRLTLPLDALYGAVGPSFVTLMPDPAAFDAIVQRTFRLSSVLFQIIAVPSVSAAVLGADLLFPSEYSGLILSSICLAGASLLVSMATPILGIYFARRHARPLLVAALAAAFLNVLLSAVLVRPYGLLGAVAANVLGSTCYIILLAVPVIRRDGRQHADVVRSFVFRSAISVVLAVAFVGGIALVTTGPARIGFIAITGITSVACNIVWMPPWARSDIGVIVRRLPPGLSRVSSFVIYRIARWAEDDTSQVSN